MKENLISRIFTLYYLKCPIFNNNKNMRQAKKKKKELSKDMNLKSSQKKASLEAQTYKDFK